jgi:hypothetical protein
MEGQDSVDIQPDESRKIIDPNDPFENGFLVPLPVDIKIEGANFGEVKAFWRAGMRRIEEQFQDHIAKMNDMFDDKTLEYERIREDLITNHEFLKRFYKDMQRKLNQKHDLI